MKRIPSLILGGLMVAGLSLAVATPASADDVTGDRYCGPPRIAGTSTTSGTGGVFHEHDDYNSGGLLTKVWTNSGVQTRFYWSGFESIRFWLHSNGGMSAYTASCDT